jgi:hypothetical protein
MMKPATLMSQSLEEDGVTETEVTLMQKHPKRSQGRNIVPETPPSIPDLYTRADLDWRYAYGMHRAGVGQHDKDGDSSIAKV